MKSLTIKLATSLLLLTITSCQSGMYSSYTPLNAEETQLVGTWAHKQGPSMTSTQYHSDRTADQYSFYKGNKNHFRFRWRLENGVMSYNSGGVAYGVQFIDADTRKLTFLSGNLSSDLHGTFLFRRFSRSEYADLADAQGWLRKLEGDDRRSRRGSDGGGLTAAQGLAALAFIWALTGGSGGNSSDDAYRRAEHDGHRAAAQQFQDTGRIQ